MCSGNAQIIERNHGNKTRGARDAALHRGQAQVSALQGTAPVAASGWGGGGGGGLVWGQSWREIFVTGKFRHTFKFGVGPSDAGNFNTANCQKTAALFCFFVFFFFAFLVFCANVLNDNRLLKPPAGQAVQGGGDFVRGQFGAEIFPTIFFRNLGYLWSLCILSGGGSQVLLRCCRQSVSSSRPFILGVTILSAAPGALLCAKKNGAPQASAAHRTGCGTGRGTRHCNRHSTRAARRDKQCCRGHWQAWCALALRA